MTKKQTKSVRIVSQSSPEISTSRCFAITEVNPAKNIEIKAKTTQFFMSDLNDF